MGREVKQHLKAPTQNGMGRDCPAAIAELLPHMVDKKTGLTLKERYKGMPKNDDTTKVIGFDASTTGGGVSTTGGGASTTGADCMPVDASAAQLRSPAVNPTHHSLRSISPSPLVSNALKMAASRSSGMSPRPIR